MNYADISPTMRRFMGNREGFRRIGFSADDLYCETARSGELGGGLAVYCTLKTQGKEFRVICGPIESEHATAAEYARVCAEQSTLSKADQDRIWRESEAYVRTVDLLRTLLQHGFVLPDPNAN